MRTPFLLRRAYLAGAALALLVAPIAFGHIRIAPAPASVAANSPAGARADDSADLIAKGKDRYNAYKCYDCHGMNGEGTDDAPDLIHTPLDADGISKFLQNPSSDATGRGMPNIPADSPDLKPLVAFVVSLKK